MSLRCSAAPDRRRWTRWPSAVRSAVSAKLAERFGSSYLARVSDPDIILSENAAKRIASIAQRQSRPAILRLAVDGGGCAGFTYKFELADRPAGGDTVAETDGVK